MMRIVIGSVGFFLLICILMGGQRLSADNQEQEIRPPGKNELYIGPNAIEMPLGRILLIRKDTDYCTIKFTNFGTGITEDDLFARYEAHYQGDKTGEFLKNNVQFKIHDLSSPKPKWSILGHPIFTGDRNVLCEDIKLWWTGRGIVCFFGLGQKQGDYGIELAPTPWTDIKEVNVKDPQVKWYRYDEKRKKVLIPIDKLWEEK